MEESTSTDLDRLHGLINDLNASIKDCQTTVDKFLEGNFGPEPNGNSLLDLKSQLLAEYVTHLSLISLRRLSAPEYSFAKHRAVILQSAKLRTMLEKAMSIEHGMVYQLDKLVQTAVAAQIPGVHGPTTSSDDPMSFRPRPGNLAGSGRKRDSEDGSASENEQGGEEGETDSDEDASDVEGEKVEKGAGAKTGKYVPPKLISMAGIEEDLVQARQDKERKRVAKLRSSVLMSELRAEMNTDEPAEIRETGATEVQRKLDKLERDRTRYEEDNFVRLSTSSKNERSKNRLMSGMGGLTDFRDLQRLMGDGGGAKKKGKRKLGKGKKAGKGKRSKK